MHDSEGESTMPRHARLSTLSQNGYGLFGAGSADLSKVYLEGFSACLVIPLLDPPQPSKFRARAGRRSVPEGAGSPESAFQLPFKFLDRFVIAF